VAAEVAFDDEVGEDRLVERRRLPDLGAAQGVFVGTPNQVVDGVAAFFAAGIDEMIFELPDAYDLDALGLASEALAPLLGQHASARLVAP
jgi:alkanesulfonate monooxygenase SsuD/methylene tetrahydromethanopterin reductase-like flavin-dependent oxidoreductase (luciferase family)